MGKNVPRKVAVEVTYMKQVTVKKSSKNDTKNRTASIMAEYNKGVVYTDVATGESDTISIKLSNTDLRWADKWIPKKGDKLTVKIIQESWNIEGEKKSFSCGKFCLDDLSLSGPTLICAIGATSIPEGNAFRSTERNKTWKKVTLKEIAMEIAKKYHLKLSYTGESIKLGTVAQSGESDCNFLNKICEEYGMAIKVYYGKIIIYDKKIFEAREIVATIDKSDMLSWSYNSTLVGTYTGATIKYTSGKDSKELKCVVGSGKRMLNINEKVESLQEARLKATARLNAENEKAETMSFTIMADFRIVAGCTIRVTGLKQINGKYFVDKVTHNIEAEGAYTMDVEVHKCQNEKEEKNENKKDIFEVGDKVVVNGLAYWGGNGGQANQCNNMTMYITQIIGSGYKYQYGVAKRKGGTRYGWCEKSSLKKT